MCGEKLRTGYLITYFLGNFGACFVSSSSYCYVIKFDISRYLERFPFVRKNR